MPSLDRCRRIRPLGLIAALPLYIALTTPIEASAQLREADITALQERIDSQGLSWTAGRTSMTDTPPDVLRAMFKPTQNNLTTAELAEMAANASPALPVPGPGVPRPWPNDFQFTWQNVNDQDWTSPVTNQAQCGSCAIFAAVSTIEASLNVAFGDPALDYDLAEQYFLDCTAASCAEGTHHIVCLNQTLNHGVPDEACMPYLAEDQECEEVCEDAQQRMARAAAWGWVADYILDPPTPEQIKAALVLGPVTSSMDVHSDFFAYVDGVYAPTANAPVVGSHAVAIIGWNDEHNSWYCKNSWGTNWGQEGYFEIERGAAGLGGPFTTWLQMDASGIHGSFEVSHDELEVIFEQGSGQSETKSVTLFRTAGTGEVPFWISPQYEPTWLTVAPIQGSVGDEDVVIEFSFSEADYEQNPGAVSCEVVIVGGNGLARVIDTRIVVMPADDSGFDDTDNVSKSDNPADAGNDNQRDPECSCGQPGWRAATTLSLADLLLSAAFRSGW